MNTKTCTKCQEDKDFVHFHKNKCGKFGISYWCKSCSSVYKKQHSLLNKEHIKSSSKLYRQQNKDKINKSIAEYNEKNKERVFKRRKRYRDQNKEKLKLYFRSEKRKKYNKKYVESNKERLQEYKNNWAKKRRKTNPTYKFSLYLRSRLYSALKNNYRNGSAVKDLGCSLEFLKSYLEVRFQPGMTWENWSLGGWHIDHKIPLASFDLTKREDLLKAVHYTNLQPMWAKENLSKGKKLNHAKTD